MAQSDEGVDTRVAKLLRGVGVGTYVSVREFARTCGLAHETVAKLLRPPKEGARPPHEGTIGKLAVGAGLPRAEVELAVLADHGYSHAVADMHGVSAVMTHLRGMSDADRRTVLAELAQVVAQRPAPPGG